MNKYLIILLFSLFIGGCSSLEKGGNIGYTGSSQENKSLLTKKYKNLYDLWNLTELEKELASDKEMYNTNSVIKKYENLLTERIAQKEQLDTLLATISNELQNGEIATLKNVLDIPMGKNILKRELKNISFQNINVFSGELTFHKETATNIIGLNEGIDTLYLDVSYALKNSKWKIIRLEEKK